MRWISRALFLIGFVALSCYVGGTIDKLPSSAEEGSRWLIETLCAKQAK